MGITNPIHLSLLKIISNHKSKSVQSQKDWVKRYLGSNKIYHDFSTGEIKDLAKNLVKENNLTHDQLIDLINSLYKFGTTYTEIAIAAMIVSHSLKLKYKFNPKHLDTWLNYTCGWAENDVLCQSNFTSDILLSNWSEWERILNQFVVDKNINKRRASLVLLTKSLSQSDDSKLSKLAFKNIEKLKSEKEILITKAVSWLLRSLVKFHNKEVLEYLKKNKDTLPKIAYRESMSKALTGKKYIKKP
jgi:3-methyladenine DNA glycosylase AlkD